jgi:hypothetical protein
MSSSFESLERSESKSGKEAYSAGTKEPERGETSVRREKASTRKDRKSSVPTRAWTVWEVKERADEHKLIYGTDSKGVSSLTRRPMEQMHVVLPDMLQRTSSARINIEGWHLETDEKSALRTLNNLELGRLAAIAVVWYASLELVQDAVRREGSD